MEWGGGGGSWITYYQNSLVDGTPNGLNCLFVCLCDLQQPKQSTKQIRKPHMMMSQRAHLNDEELVCLKCLLFKLI